MSPTSYRAAPSRDISSDCPLNENYYTTNKPKCQYLFEKNLIFLRQIFHGREENPARGKKSVSERYADILCGKHHLVVLCDEFCFHSDVGELIFGDFAVNHRDG